jgi:glycosyltransferase involved in cell wall biosynthesis
MACKFAEKNPKFLVYQNARNLGRVENWNRGLSLSGGEYLKPVMVNDYLLPTCLDELCKVLDENPNAAMARCSMTTLNNGVLNFEPLFPESRMHWGLEAIEYGLTTANIAAGPSAQMFRSAPILDHKLRYDTRYEWAADFEFTMRLFAAGGIFYLRQSLFVYEYTKRYATQSKFRVELRDELNVIGSMADLYKEHLDRETLQRAQARAQSLYKYYRGRCSTDEEQAQCDLLWEQAQSTFPMLRQTLDVSSTFTRDIGQKFNFDPATCR